MSAQPGHVPVLLDEVIAALSAGDGDVVIDATFGGGGYTRALLDAGATVHAFDRDPDAIAAGRKWNEAQIDPPRLVLHHRRFSEMWESMADAGMDRADAITMDIGVSSMQLDQVERGFAFQSDGPLDMRMAQEGETAAEFLNGANADTIADILYQYGEERQSRRIARAIVAARPLETTAQLARIVRAALRHPPGAPKDPATRTFQAIRIHINAELEELHAGLAAAEALLGEGGRLAVVSFHSLEDRIVKRYLRDATAVAAGSRHLPQAVSPTARYRDLSKAIRPGAAELARNPRARSSTLRHAIRTGEPALAEFSPKRAGV